MCNIIFLFHSLEVEDFVPPSFYRVAALTVVLQCELYFLTFHIEKWRDIMTFSGLLSVQHPYREVFLWLVCAFFEFAFCLMFSRNCVWNCSVLVYLSKITLHIVGRHHLAQPSPLILTVAQRSVATGMFTPRSRCSLVHTAHILLPVSSWPSIPGMKLSLMVCPHPKDLLNESSHH